LVTPQCRLHISTAEAAIDAAIKGLGVTNVLSYQVAQDSAADIGVSAAGARTATSGARCRVFPAAENVKGELAQACPCAHDAATAPFKHSIASPGARPSLARKNEARRYVR
jgi:hypothetical protein